MFVNKIVVVVVVFIHFLFFVLCINKIAIDFSIVPDFVSYNKYAELNYIYSTSFFLWFIFLLCFLIYYLIISFHLFTSFFVKCNFLRQCCLNLFVSINKKKINIYLQCNFSRKISMLWSQTGREKKNGFLIYIGNVKVRIKIKTNRRLLFLKRINLLNIAQIVIIVLFDYTARITNHILIFFLLTFHNFGLKIFPFHEMVQLMIMALHIKRSWTCSYQVLPKFKNGK